MAKLLRVGLIQMRSGPDARANRAAAEPLVREAAAGGARLIATPENTVRMNRNRTAFTEALRSEAEETELRAWGVLAREHGVYLLLGSAPIDAGGGKAFNRSFLFTPDGKITARYDKIHMFDVELGGGERYRESETMQAGEKAVLVEGPAGVKLGLTICYDLRFPGLYQRLAKAGAEIIACPAAFTKTTGAAHWETLLRARAIETGAFVIAPAQGGLHEDGRETWGHSVIFGPWGEKLAELPHDEPGLLLKDLDLEAVSAARAKIPAWAGGPSYSGPDAP